MQLAPGIPSTAFTPQYSGTIKQVPEDFIVQEMHSGEVAQTTRKDCLVSSTNPCSQAVLVKRGLSTTEAIHALAQSANVPVSAISYFGRKDVVALTAQFITISTPFQLEIAPDSSYWLHSISPAQVRAKLGDHDGNHFIITVRTNQPATAAKSIIQFHNYFDTQRFGPRGNNHLIGKALITGDFATASSLLLFQTTSLEPESTRALRQYMGSASYQDALDAIAPFTHELRSEKALLETRLQGGTDSNFWSTHIPQARFFCNAYGSYLWNMASAQVHNEENTFPTPDHSEEIRNLYASLTGERVPVHPPIRALSLRRSDRLQVVSTEVTTNYTQEGQVLSFSLPQGTYATTLLRTLYYI